jgi:molecular chaperone DnaJ
VDERIGGVPIATRGYISATRFFDPPTVMAPMAAKRDYYEVLGIARTATEKEVAVAYRKLAIKFHPDSNSGDAEAAERFKEAAEAYEVLGNAEKRARYDQFGHAGLEGMAGGASHFDSVEDIFEAFGDIFGGGGFFGDLFGGGRRRVRRGADIRVDVTLDLEEAASGVTKEVQFNRSEKCETCGGGGNKPGSSRQMCRRCAGHGQVTQSAGILRVQTTCPTCRGTGSIITDPCEDCGGAGYVARRVTKPIPIPAGVDDGTRLRIRGEGEPSPDGGPPGDCYCFIRVREHKIFQRDGRHLILHLPISYTQAALGATIEVPTLEGREELKIAAGTQSGEVFQIQGKGMPDPHGGRRGNLVVQVAIDVPKKLDSRQEELLRELAEMEHANVTPHRKSFLEKLRDYFAPPEDEGE